MSNGKGDKRRPMLISQNEWKENWDAIFGNSKTSDKAENDRRRQSLLEKR